MPFYDVTEQSTRTRERHARKIIDTLRDAFQMHASFKTNKDLTFRGSFR